ncbi:MAG: YjbQ family protein [Euryarchaeota archaeon]|nr:YjbQ family protein [Euryarchaeota archaeon]
MGVLHESFGLRTSRRLEIRDITNEIAGILKKANIKNGLINVFTRHSTSGIVINENESRLIKDFENALKSLIPSDRNYLHNAIDNNADSHIRAFYVGSSETIPVENGSMNLGTWQSVFFVELDGPRSRKVMVTVIGE